MKNLQKIIKSFLSIALLLAMIGMFFGIHTNDVWIFLSYTNLFVLAIILGFVMDIHYELIGLVNKIKRTKNEKEKRKKIQQD